MNNKLLLFCFMIFLGLAFGYFSGLPTTTLKSSCSDLNASAAQYQCEAVKNPLSQQGLEYYISWVILSPLILLIFLQIYYMTNFLAFGD